MKSQQLRCDIGVGVQLPLVHVVEDLPLGRHDLFSTWYQRLLCTCYQGFPFTPSKYSCSRFRISPSPAPAYRRADWTHVIDFLPPSPAVRLALNGVHEEHLPPSPLVSVEKNGVHDDYLPPPSPTTLETNEVHSDYCCRY